MRIVTTATLLSLALPLCREPAAAQQPKAQIAVSGGVATDQRGVRSSAISIAPTLTLQPSMGVALQLGGNATRFGTEVWSLGANAALSGRNPLGRFAALTLSANGSASTLASGASATFALGEIVPAVELFAGPLTLFGGARATAGRSSQPGVISGPPPIIGGARDTPSIVETTAAAGPLGWGVWARTESTRIASGHTCSSPTAVAWSSVFSQTSRPSLKWTSPGIGTLSGPMAIAPWGTKLVTRLPSRRSTSRCSTSPDSRST